MPRQPSSAGIRLTKSCVSVCYLKVSRCYTTGTRFGLTDKSYATASSGGRIRPACAPAGQETIRESAARKPDLQFRADMSTIVRSGAVLNLRIVLLRYFSAARAEARNSEDAALVGDEAECCSKNAQAVFNAASEIN